MRYELVTPYLWVKDVDRSLEFYRDAVGLEVVNEFRADDGTLDWCFVQGGMVTFMLSRYAGRVVEPEDHDDHDHPPPGRPDEVGQPYVDSSGHGNMNPVFWVYVDDVDAIHAQLVERGVTPDGPPEDQPYGIRDFLVRDPDGYALVFATDPEDG